MHAERQIWLHVAQCSRCALDIGQQLTAILETTGQAINRGVAEVVISLRQQRLKDSGAAKVMRFIEQRSRAYKRLAVDPVQHRQHLRYQDQEMNSGLLQHIGKTRFQPLKHIDSRHEHANSE